MLFETQINEIIERESKKETNDPNDSGGRTKYGISERFHPEAWKNGPPTEEVAKQIYLKQYILDQGFQLIEPVWLMEHLVDFGVPSGPRTAIKHLQKILNVEEDGIIGPQTLEALKKRDPKIVNNKLVDARILMFARLVQKRPKDLKWLGGWIIRALKFRLE